MDEDYSDEALLLMRVASVSTRRKLLEADLAACRRSSRTLCLALIFKHGYSVNKVARLTGHYRPTLDSWIRVAKADGHQLRPEQETED
jgi:transposase-like protein